MDSIKWSGGVVVQDYRSHLRIRSVEEPIRTEQHNVPLSDILELMTGGAVPRFYYAKPGSGSYSSKEQVRSTYKYDSCYSCGAPPRPGRNCDYCGREH